MKYGLVVGGLVASLSTARAQAPGSAEPIASFLEHRVSEELAADGIVLSRRGLTLHVEQSGDLLILSLVDVATQHVEASTKLDAVPVDREAAVGTTTQLVAALAAQVATHAPVAIQVADPRAQQVAELQFRRDAIRFGDDYHISVSQYGGSVRREWFAMHGELDQRLDPHEFYRLVGRPDLADAYDHRHRVMLGGLVVGGVGMTASLVALIAMRPTLQIDSCAATDPNYQMCLDAANTKFLDEQQDAMLVGFGLLGVGTIGLVVGLWYHYHPHPISEDEAKQLADQHNQALRRTLGLPIVDVQLAPIATASSGGFALSGRF